MKAFLLSLKHPDYYGEKLKLKIPQSGTCEWIFTHPQYLAWCADQDTSVLYSMGKPGSGKTVLSRHVLETLQHSSSSPKNTQVLYYFCNNRDNPNLTATDVLAAIVHQLLSQIPSLFPYIAKKANLNKSSSEVILWPLESLWDMFTIMVAASHLEVIYCILDALDECEAESISELSLLITKMTEESKESEDSPKLKFYLTSRPFQSLKEDLTTARVIYLTPEIVKTDIEKVVDDGMERLQKRLRLKKDVKDRLWNMLVERSEGMFLWVLLAIKQLDRARGLTAQKLEALMQGLPKGLDGIYDRMLEALENDPDDLALARKMLSWVILAPRPLTIPEFREAMAVQESSYSVDSIQEHLMFNVSRDIRTICGSFLEVISGMGDPKMITNSDDDTQENDVDEDPKATVRLIHQSAKDYFFDKSRRLGSHLSRYRIDEQQGHNEIAITCLTYLLFIDFKKSPIKREHIPPRPFTPSASPIDINDTKNIHMLLEDRIAQYPFLEYAVLLWADHVRCGGETFGHKSANSLVTELVCRFLRQPIALEFWHQIYFFRTTFIQKGHDPTDYPKMITPLHAACFLRLPHVIQYLLHNCNADINETSSSGENALLYSVSALSDRTSLHTLKVILGSFPTINIRDGYGRSVLARAASTGSVEGIELLLEAGADINDKAVEVLPALHVAARLGHSGVVELLIARGADIEIKNNGSTALHLAAQQGHTQVVSILLDSGVGIESRDHHDSTALDSAAYEGHIHVISLLLDRGADIESRDHYDSTALHKAARRGHAQVVSILLDRGADIESRDHHDSTALTIAAEQGHAQVVSILLDRGAGIESRDEDDLTALDSAAYEGHIHIVSLLLDRGADIESGNQRGTTALYSAAQQGHAQVVSLLLDRGADIESRNQYDSTALTMAAQQGHIHVVSLLLDRGADIESRSRSGTTALDSAAYQGHIHVVSLLLDRGADIESRDHYDSTALYNAAQRGHAQVVSILLDRGADIESRDQRGTTALYSAAQQGHAQVVSLLLDRGADTESRCQRDSTALHKAAQQGHAQVVSILLDSGAGIESRDKYDSTALDSAAYEGHIHVVSLLLDRGADIESRDRYDSTALYNAARRGHAQVVSILLDRGADIESRSQGGTTALDSAAYQGHIHVVSLLLDRGADIESRSRSGTTALDSAAYQGHIHVVSLLLDRGADIESKPQKLSKVLHLAVLYGHHEIVSSILDKLATSNKAAIGSTFRISAGLLQLTTLGANRNIFRLLLDHEIDVNMATLRGCTALHVAASCGYLDIVESLLVHGADPHTRDIQGWSPIDCARKSRKAQVIERLSQLQTSSSGDHQIVTQSPTHWSPEDKSTHIELSDGNLHVRVSGRNHDWSSNGVTTLMFQEDIARLKWVSVVRSNFCMPAEKDNCYYEAKIIEGVTGYIYSRLILDR
jgi:ankyrin repeat protein